MGKPDGEVTLRPVNEDDLPVLLKSTQDPEMTGEFEWAGWHDPRVWRLRWNENGLISPDGGVLMVDLGSETPGPKTPGPKTLGLVSYRRHQTGPVSQRWEIGIALLPEARGHGYGTRAQRLLVDYLFAHTPVHRIEAGTEVGNVAEQRALERVGFTREGVLRGLVWRDGAWRDSVVYSILRSDLTVITRA
jgi:RimJ/RimL family protein N-acetyltransferase